MKLWKNCVLLLLTGLCLRQGDTGQDERVSNRGENVGSIENNHDEFEDSGKMKERQGAEEELLDGHDHQHDHQHNHDQHNHDDQHNDHHFHFHEDEGDMVERGKQKWFKSTGDHESSQEGAHHGHEHDHHHNHYHHDHHDHFHEDEVDLVKQGKEKWLKPAVDELKHETVGSPESETDSNRHDHDHAHHDHAHHDHAHHDHGHHDHGHDHHNHHHHHEYKTIKPKSEKQHDEPQGHESDQVNRGKKKWFKPVSDHHGHEHLEGDGSTTRQQASWDTWWQSLLATVLISAAPYFILYFIPLESNKGQEPLLKLLLSFASGGLLGDAFLHLIPHAINPHVHGAEDIRDHTSHHHDHHHHHHHSNEGAHEHHHDMSVGVWVLAGIIAFLVVEMFVRHVKSEHSHFGGHSHSCPPSTGEKKSKNKKEEKDKKGSEKKEGEEDEQDNDGVKDDDKDQEQEEHKEQEEQEEQSNNSQIKVSGYLNLAADFSHNFTDGLAIGASFLMSRNLGVITTLTVLLHEVPHEIGDFAILVQSGYTKQKAMLLQLTTATGALAGCMCGLLADNLSMAATSWILPFTAGGFIYIATVSVIPELLEESSFKQSVKEVVAMLVGILMMVLMCYFE